MTRRRQLLAVVAVAFVARCAAGWLWWDDLIDDIDGYLRLANSLREGAGFASPNGEPTAFRPPLYPAVVAGFDVLLPGAMPPAILVLHLLCGVTTVWLVFRLAECLQVGRPWLAAAAIACDPILLRYTALPMTEVLFSTLATALLWLLVSGNAAVGAQTTAGSKSTANAHGVASVENTRRAFYVGATFGACAMCRPTIWAFGGLMLAWAVLRRPRFVSWRTTCGCAAGVLLLVLPWTIRNWARLGRPVFTTSHGGYTLLLGNNPIFYREVVDAPWGTLWSGDSLDAWQKRLEVELRADGVDAADEVARDRWMYRRAVANIREQPGACIRASLLRVGRLWNPLPLTGDRASTRWPVGLWYVAVLALAATGIARVFHGGRCEWAAVLLLVGSFTLVHLLYWSNARMRAPLMPAVALLAAVGLSGSRSARESSTFKE